MILEYDKIFNTINTMDIHTYTLICSCCAGIAVDNKKFGKNILKVTHRISQFLYFILHLH